MLLFENRPCELPGCGFQVALAGQHLSEMVLGLSAPGVEAGGCGKRLEGLIELAGFEVVAEYSDYAGSPPANGNEIIVVARRRAGRS